jgi:hypothetical protein
MTEVAVKACLITLALAGSLVGSERPWAQAPFASLQSSVVLMDSAGNGAARLLYDTIVLMTVSPDVLAPAFIAPIYDADARTASGLATWASGGSVLFTSADCSTGAHIHTLTNAGLRSTSQVETPGGIILYVGAEGMPFTVDVQSILYGTGCSAVRVRQNGLVAVVATVNLTTTFPPPLSFH